MTHQFLPAPDAPTEFGPPAPPDLRGSLDRGVRTLWRWRGRFAAAFGAVVLLGGLSLLVLPVRYTASAMVIVGFREPDPVVTGQTMPQPREREPDVDGAIQLITSVPVLRYIVKKLDLEHRPEFQEMLQKAAGSGDADRAARAALDPNYAIVRKLESRLSVTRLGHSMLIRIAYTDRDPVFAATVANALANTSTVDETLLSHLTMFDRAGFDLVKTWLAAPAVVPVTPSSPNLLIIFAATLVIGIAAGWSSVMLADYYESRTVLSADQLTRRGVRALGLIPDLGPDLAENQSVVALVSAQPREAYTDAIAALHASLMPLVPQNPPSCLVLLFVSALPQEGKSTTAAALAASIASSAHRVLLIDADLRSPSLHLQFGISGERGLANCLDAGVDLGSLIQLDPISGVSLLPAGAYHPRPMEVLGSLRLRQAIETWRDAFEFILIDAPPVLPIADPRILVPLADYCVFIARWGRTGWGVVSHGLRLLADSGARIAGIAVSRVDVRRFSTYGFPDAGVYGIYRDLDAREE